jgi:DeoR family transcriptional regulator of aga operon
MEKEIRPSNNAASFSTVDRRSTILEIINQRGKIHVDELSKAFSVSEVTVRNDLKKLEKDGFLRRTHGGALKANNVAFDLTLMEKAKKHADEKRAIGAKAAEMIYDGDTIILDSGTTTFEIARNIKEKKKKNITVITNALNIATELAGVEGIGVVLTGGMLREKSFSLVGPHAEQTLKDYFGDKLFLGVDGICTDYGITTPNLLEAQVNRLMVERSNEVIVVTDSSKFGRRSLCLIVDLSSIDKIITDHGIPENDLSALRSKDVEVSLVETR